MIKLKSFFIVWLMIIISIAYAQKLPKIQQTSVRAPTNIKIDGKATEWNNHFEAYNNATEVFYTIANDDDNLYLVLQATDPAIIKKIVTGGVTLTINRAGKKTDKNAIAITYPVCDEKEPPNYLVLNNDSKRTANTTTNKIKADSLRNMLNLNLGSKLKMIGLMGIKTIPDSVISVYNEEGIKAASLFDSQIRYTWELAVPLKYLGLTFDKPQFSYGVRLNGAATNRATIDMSPSGRFLIITRPGQEPYAMPVGIAGVTAMVYPTDFWGEYALIKE